MRSISLMSVSLAALAGCAAKQHPAAQQEYLCTAGSVSTYDDHDGRSLLVGNERAELVARDRDGEHYVLDSVEYVIPQDRRLDATVWARSSESARLPVETCLATGGHRDLVKRRLIDNETLEQTAASLGEDRAAVRTRLLAALRWMRQDILHGRTLAAPLAVPTDGKNGRQDLPGR